MFYHGEICQDKDHVVNFGCYSDAVTGVVTHKQQHSTSMVVEPDVSYTHRKSATSLLLQEWMFQKNTQQANTFKQHHTSKTNTQSLP